MKRCYPLGLSLLFTLLLTAGTGDTTPVVGLHQNHPDVYAFTNATLQITPETRVEKATLVIRNGLIEQAGKNAKTPADATVIDLDGKVIYPGFIDLYAQYGLDAHKKDKPKKDKPNQPGAHHWNNRVQPERSPADHFHADDKAAEAAREAGFTTVLTGWEHGVFTGQTALVLLTEGSPNQLILADGLTQNLNLETAYNQGYPGSQMGVLALMRQTFSDAKWYDEAHRIHAQNPAGTPAPESNPALAALAAAMKAKQPLLFAAEDDQEVLRIAKLTNGLGMPVWVHSEGYDYRRLAEIQKTGIRLILPLDFPAKPKVDTLDDEQQVSLREMRHWHFAPANPGMVAEADIPFVLTRQGHDKAADFWKHLRRAHERGLSKSKALAALTTQPAAWLGMSQSLGSLETGRMANFFITDGDLFEKDTKVLQTWVRGTRHGNPDLKTNPIVGAWSLKADDLTGELTFKGDDKKLSGELKRGDQTDKLNDVSYGSDVLNFSYKSENGGVIRFVGALANQSLSGHFVNAAGKRGSWTATASTQAKADDKKEADDKAKKGKGGKNDQLVLPVVFPEGAYGLAKAPEQPKQVLIKNATLWTSGPDGILEDTDMLIEDGKIAKIGKGLKAGRKAVTIDAAGKHVTPGIIDEHSHTAISKGVNEGTSSITSEVRIGDVIDADEINMYRGLAGGQTVAQLLHGSANPIGGQAAVIKYRWGQNADGLVFEDAEPSIKFALGENVKQSNWGDEYTTRYPQTRMGVEQFFHDAFNAALDYRAAKEAYAADPKGKLPPRTNYRLETLLEILDGKRKIHCHSYRQDEILALIRVADHFKFQLGTFTHILEGYKVADDMKKHGVHASTFSDWWAYKFEVYDAIPYNGAIMHNQGLVVSFNSDSSDLARRLNLEAAKAVKYGGVSREEALKFVTLNPAIQLGVQDRVGSLEVGKDADFALWSGDPLSTFSHCEQTWIEGRKYFDREQDMQMQAEAATQRAKLIQEILAAEDDGSAKRGKKEEKEHSCREQAEVKS